MTSLLIAVLASLRATTRSRSSSRPKFSRSGISLPSTEEVLFVELKNRPGALAKAVEKLARARISIRYAYATASSRTQKTAAVIAVANSDLPKALELLG